MRMNIPGYYFDAEKKRYFKIEGNQTAPNKSAWSADNVKKRKLDDQKAEEALRRLNLNKNRIKPAQLLNNPLTGGFLIREYGCIQQDMARGIFANGLVEKGSVPFKDARWSPSQNITDMCIVGEDPWTDLGFAYVCPDGSALTSTYIPRDRRGRVHRRLLAEYSTPGNRISPYHEASLDQVSSLKFHRRRGILIIGQSEPRDRAAIRAVIPSQASQNEKEVRKPCFRLGERPLAEGVVEAEPLGQPGRDLSMNGLGPRRGYEDTTMAPVPQNEAIFESSHFQINVLALGPDGSQDIICAAGTNRGILQWKGEHCMTVSGSPQWAAPILSSRLPVDTTFRDIFAVEYQRGHENLILGGGRPGRCFVVDTRTRDQNCLSFRHGSSITHIRSLNEHHVLISGTQDTLQIYDTRMIKANAQIVSKWGNSRRPKKMADRSLVSFFEYKNSAHNKIGLDIDLDTGIVATAHDDGKVALHSLKTGHRVEAPAIDCIQANVQERGPIKALQFETMSGDIHPSLFAAVGNNLRVYSFGPADANDDEV